MKNELFIDMQFCSWVAKSYHPQFLASVSKILEDNLKKNIKDSHLDKEMYPLGITNNIIIDNSIIEFADCIVGSVWKILTDQGYDLSNLQVYISSMYGQSHSKGSGQEQHLHSGSLITAFYFIEVPVNSCQVLFHDPRPGKVSTDLPLKDINLISGGSQTVAYTPRPGDLIFSNSWLPHTISRNLSDDPFKFIHITTNVSPITYQPHSNKLNQSPLNTTIV